MITNLSATNSLLSVWMREIRDVTVQNDRMRFRRNLERVGEIAAYEISKTLPYFPAIVPTPLGEATCQLPVAQPVLATILRAGLPLHQGLLNYFDAADCAFVAAYRKHHKDGSFEIAQQYLTCPPLDDRPLIIADPMLATGASLILCVEALLRHGTPTSLHVVTGVACTVGLEQVIRRFPNAHIWCGDIDEELTARAYIVPGLGDAGDLAYGDKKQD